MSLRYISWLRDFPATEIDEREYYPSIPIDSTSAVRNDVAAKY